MWKKSYSIQQSPKMNIIKKIISKVSNKRDIWANLIGWWLIGICVDFVFCTVIAAAHDLLSLHEGNTNKNSSQTRHCNKQSEGFILVVDVLPSLITTLILPFLPLRIHIRFVFMVLILVSSILLVSVNLTWGMTLTGIALCSMYTGLGYSTFIRYMDKFKNNSKISAQSLIYAWSSGIGASGFFASFYYTITTEIGVSVQTLLFSLLIIPAALVFTFCVLISDPQETLKTKELENINKDPQKELQLEFKQKIRILNPVIANYTAPFTLVFFFEYLTNQGFFELMNFNNSFISVASSVRWLQFAYMFSNFLFKSLGCWIQMDCLWTLTAFQFINLMLLFTQAMYGWMGRGVFAFTIVLVLVFWEGFVASVSYVNTFRRLNNERPDIDRGFSLSITAFGEPLGILSAGFASMIVHHAICELSS